MDNQPEQLALVRTNGYRKWKILGAILALVCFAVYIVLAVWLFKHFTRVLNTTTNETLDTTTTTMVPDRWDQYKNYTLTGTVQYDDSSGRALDNSLYLNTQQISAVTGYVSHVYIRLFTSWKGDAPLDLFVLTITGGNLIIRRQYGVQPQRDTTEWQTIKIPPDVLAVSYPDFLAAGMQVGGRGNAIFVVKGIMSLTARNITAGIVEAVVQGSIGSGVALGFAVAYNGTRQA